MKKLFLIPLMTLFCTVMAFAEEVSTKEALQAALNAGGEIALGANINLGASQVTMTSGTVVLDLNGHTLTSSLGSYAADKGTLNVSGGNLTVKATNGGGISNTGSSGVGIMVSNNANVTVKGGSFGGYENIMVRGAEVTVEDGTFTSGGDNAIWLYTGTHAKVTIKGGTYNGGWMCFQVDADTELKIEGGTFTQSTNANTGIIYSTSTSVIEIIGGVFIGESPAKFVNFSEALMVADGNTYTVSQEITGNVYNFDKYIVYNNLQDAVDAADNGNHILVLNNGMSATVSKNLTFDLSGKSATVSAGAGFQKSVNGDFVAVMASDNLGAYLNGDTETPFTVSTNTNLGAIGLVRVKGNKKITINEGVTVSGTYKVRYPSILVPNGAKLTIEGDGTIAADRSPIVVEKGGELIIGKADKSDQLKITTSYNKSVNLAITNYGKTTINNAEIHAKSAVAQTYGEMTILGGIYTSEASTATAHKYCITSDNEGQLTLKNSTVKGVHGAICVQGLNADIKGGNAYIDNCEIIATNNPNGTVISGAVHYAIYSATGGIVSIYNTKMKSTAQDQAIHIGNNDAYNTFGLVYLYEGCMVKAPEGKRIWVQKKTALDKDVLFPISVDENSAWYTAAMTGGEGPLPAGYTWEAITSGADYDAGYRWKVVSSAAKETAAATTIPWQATTTWSSSEVPDETTAVTIPEGKTVVVDNTQSDTDVEANQITIGGEGASLTVQEGTSLDVTNGVNIANGGKFVIDEGAVVFVGAGGVIAASDNSIEIKASEDKASAFLLAPGVTENTQPSATYKFISKARYDEASGIYTYQRFGIPTFNGKTTMTWEGSVKTSLDRYNSAIKNWEHIYTVAPNRYEIEGKPFQCYNMTVNEDQEVEYTFTGFLMGNKDITLDFVAGWNNYANCYTAPINTASLLERIKTQFGEGINGAIYFYKRNETTNATDWQDITIGEYETFGGEAYLIAKGVDEIRPMQAFILNLRQGSEAQETIGYEENVYDPFYAKQHPEAPAARRTPSAHNSNNTGVVLYVSDGVNNDKLALYEADNLTEEFDKGYDADKLDNDFNFSIYCLLGDAKLSSFGSNKLEDHTIAFDTKIAGDFTLKVDIAVGELVKIYDTVAKKLIDLTTGAEYVFHADAMNDPARFIINPSDAPSAVDNTDVVVKASKFVGQDGQIYIRRAGNVYTVQGQGVK